MLFQHLARCGIRIPRRKALIFMSYPPSLGGTPSSIGSGDDPDRDGARTALAIDHRNPGHTRPVRSPLRAVERLAVDQPVELAVSAIGAERHGFVRGKLDTRIGRWI